MAEVNIYCPHCNRELSVDDSYMGKNLVCPLCNGEFLFDDPDKDAVQVPSSIRLKESAVLKNSILNSIEDTKEQKKKRKLRMNPVEIRELREQLAKGFSTISACNSVSKINIFSAIFEGIGDIIGAVFVLYAKAQTARIMKKMVHLFQVVKGFDIDYLEDLDILERYGKSEKQLAAASHTLFSPIISGDDDEEMEVKYKFFDDDEDAVLIYSYEEVTKLYPFEDQLFVYRAAWDYVNGCICAEQTEAFFFKDITDISTETEYKAVEEKVVAVGLTWLPWIVAIVCASIGIGIGSSIGVGAVGFLGVLIGGVLGCVAGLIIGSIIRSIILALCSKKYDVMVRASETFTITSSSGRSISSTIVCDEWLEANNASYNRRSNPEKIIHAIRRMIEEKKVAANE